MVESSQSSKAGDWLSLVSDQLRNNDPSLTVLNSVLNKNLNDNEVINEIAILLRDNTRVHTLDFRNLDELRSDNCMELAQTLKVNTSIKRFIIANAKLNQLMTEFLCEGIKENQTLTVFDLSDNADIGFRGLPFLFNAFRHNTSLKVVDMSRSIVLQFHDYSLGKILESALVHNSTIELLNLSNNNLGDKFISAAFSNGLKYNTTIQTLDLDGCNIGHDGAVALANAMCTNTTIVCLKLNNNRIGETSSLRQLDRNDDRSTTTSRRGVTSTTAAPVVGTWNENNNFCPIAKMLYYDAPLKELYLDNNGFSDIGITSIAKAVRYHRTLKVLSLNQNINANTNTGTTTSTSSNASFADAGFLELINSLEYNETLTTLHLNGLVLSDITQAIVTNTANNPDHIFQFNDTFKNIYCPNYPAIETLFTNRAMTTARRTLSNYITTNPTILSSSLAPKKHLRRRYETNFSLLNHWTQISCASSPVNKKMRK